MKLGRCLGSAILLSFRAARSRGRRRRRRRRRRPSGATYNWQLGPKPLDLGHDVQLSLPAGYAFLGMPDADRFLKKNGSFDNEGVLGVVLSQDENAELGRHHRLRGSGLRQGRREARRRRAPEVDPRGHRRGQQGARGARLPRAHRRRLDRAAALRSRDAPPGLGAAGDVDARHDDQLQHARARPPRLRVAQPA